MTDRYSTTPLTKVSANIFAPVGSKDYGSLAVLHHLCARLDTQLRLGAKCFFPVPKVDSAFLCMRASDTHGLTEGELRQVERVARAGCRTFMLGYQAMDGVPITANRWLLNDVLKDEWGEFQQPAVF